MTHPTAAELAHFLSEWLDDAAPLNERYYLPCAEDLLRKYFPSYDPIYEAAKKYDDAYRSTTDETEGHGRTAWDTHSIWNGDQ